MILMMIGTRLARLVALVVAALTVVAAAVVVDASCRGTTGS